MSNSSFHLYNPIIENILKEWVNAQSSYSFEKRLHLIANPSIFMSNPSHNYVDVVFIIDVSGFYEDEKCTKPIKLHYERCISIERLNSSSKYADDLRRDLDLFTKSAYYDFKTLLASYAKTYTTDPLYMKV